MPIGKAEIHQVAMNHECSAKLRLITQTLKQRYLLVLVRSLKHLAPSLFDRNFNVFADHRTLMKLNDYDENSKRSISPNSKISHTKKDTNNDTYEEVKRVDGDITSKKYLVTGK